MLQAVEVMEQSEQRCNWKTRDNCVLCDQNEVSCIKRQNAAHVEGGASLSARLTLQLNQLEIALVCNREKQRFDNKFMRRIFGPKRYERTAKWRKLRNEEFRK